jgi:hypothetical protein
VELIFVKDVLARGPIIAVTRHLLVHDGTATVSDR